MLKLLQIILPISFCVSCNNVSKENEISISKIETKPPTKICEIPLPKGFERNKQDSTSFAFYLQHINLKKDNTVYYYDGSKKINQTLHYAVMDIPVGNKDLQQCADAIMRLRAKYFLERKEYNKIEFKSTNRIYNFQEFLNHTEVTSYEKGFDVFMENVFANCGTYNLSNMLHTKQDFNDLAIGDVFVKGGSPGHAMIVVDVAYNKQTQEKIFLLAEGFMPAQSVHIVTNPYNEKFSPWYKANLNLTLITPGYTFASTNLKEW